LLSRAAARASASISSWSRSNNWSIPGQMRPSGLPLGRQPLKCSRSHCSWACSRANLLGARKSASMKPYTSAQAPKTIHHSTMAENGTFVLEGFVMFSGRGRRVLRGVST
jgi:hypothetical protein